MVYSVIQGDTVAKEKDKKAMVRRGLKVDLSLWEKAKTKAGITPISAVIRRLLEKWLKDEVDIND